MAEPAEKTEEQYDKARDLAEAALEQYAKGKTDAGDELAEKAVKIDRHAVEDIVEEMDKDAAATGSKKGEA